MAPFDPTVKVKLVVDTEHFREQLEQQIASVELPLADPLAVALRDRTTAADVVTRVGDETFRLSSWSLTAVNMVTRWESTETLEDDWRIPWGDRARLAVDRIWWRAMGWL